MILHVSDQFLKPLLIKTLVLYSLYYLLRQSKIYFPVEIEIITINKNDNSFTRKIAWKGKLIEGKGIGFVLWVLVDI